MLFHKHNINKNFNKSDIRFTKVLTKYSTEYNNSTFIQEICQKLNMDIKDMYAFFIEIKVKNTEEQISNILEDYEINKLDIKRIYKLLDTLLLIN